jgi:hypothetical protein
VKLRKALEITIRYPINKSVPDVLWSETWLLNPADTQMLEYWKPHLISSRVVYRLANQPLYNSMTDGPPF